MPLPHMMPQPLQLPVQPIKHGYLNKYPETPRETLEDHGHCEMTAATEPVGVSKVFPRSPIESLSKDRYFVSGSGIDSSSGITK